MCSSVGRVHGGNPLPLTHMTPSRLLLVVVAMLSKLPSTCSTWLPCLRPFAAGGCDALRWSFRQGLPNVRGARQVLSLTFAPGSGYLLPIGVPEENTTLVQVTGGRTGPFNRVL